jgi:hypothetical protein
MEPTKILGREEILSQRLQGKDRVKLVPIPAWGGSVYIRRLSTGEVEAWNAANIKRVGKRHEYDHGAARTRLLVLCLCNAVGDRLFHDYEDENLRTIDFPGVAEVYDECKRFNGLDDDEEKAEERRKNSAATPTSASPSS